MTQFDKIRNTIFLDMDGVVADFDAFVLEHMGKTFNHQDGPADAEMWNFLATVDNMYYWLPKTSYADELVQMAIDTGANVEFLTAIPRRTSIFSAAQDKRNWVQKHYGNMKVNIGPFSKDKWKWARHGDILIDDRTDNIEQWIGADGIGILHKYTDFDSTRSQFKQIFT